MQGSVILMNSGIYTIHDCNFNFHIGKRNTSKECLTILRTYNFSFYTVHEISSEGTFEMKSILADDACLVTCWTDHKSPAVRV